MPVADGVVGLPDLHLLPVELQLPRGLAGATPKSVSMTSVLPAPMRPATPKISPRRTEKLTSRNMPLAGVSPSNLQHRLADGLPAPS